METNSKSKKRNRTKRVKTSDNPFRKLREAAGLTQEQLAKAMGIGQQTISSYENGKMPSVPMIKKFAVFFNTSTDYLLGMIDNPMPPTQLHMGELSKEEADIVNNYRLYDNDGKIFVNTAFNSYSKVAHIKNNSGKKKK